LVHVLASKLRGKSPEISAILKYFREHISRYRDFSHV
jgi:hypothetical protein